MGRHRLTPGRSPGSSHGHSARLRSHPGLLHAQRRAILTPHVAPLSRLGVRNYRSGGTPGHLVSPPVPGRSPGLHEPSLYRPVRQPEPPISLLHNLQSAAPLPAKVSDAPHVPARLQKTIRASSSMGQVRTKALQALPQNPHRRALVRNLFPAGGRLGRGP
jgi:hypothetical protein